MNHQCMRDTDYQIVYAEAYKQAEHCLYAYPGRYHGAIEKLIEETLRETAFVLDSDLLLRNTMDDLKDVCLHAAYTAVLQKGTA